MSVRKLLALIMFLVLPAAFLLMGNAQAQTQTVTPPPPPTSVTGTAQIGVTWNHGNDVTGGWANGQALGSFSATDLCLASGNANANGLATGTSGPITNGATSTSRGIVSSDATANGGLSASVGLSGFGEQGNWASIGSDNNFASGANTTHAEYDGMASGTGSLQGIGAGSANGTTTVTQTMSPTSAQTHSVTEGDSLARMQFTGATGTGSTLASGNGALAAISTLGGGTGDKFFAGASIEGTALYNSVGNMLAGGNLKIDGTTSASTTPTSATSSASVSSVARAINDIHCGNVCGGN